MAEGLDGCWDSDWMGWGGAMVRGQTALIPQNPPPPPRADRGGAGGPVVPPRHRGLGLGVLWGSICPLPSSGADRCNMSGFSPGLLLTLPSRLQMVLTEPPRSRRRHDGDAGRENNCCGSSGEVGACREPQR